MSDIQIYRALPAVISYGATVLHKNGKNNEKHCYKGAGGERERERGIHIYGDPSASISSKVITTLYISFSLRKDSVIYHRLSDYISCRFNLTKKLICVCVCVCADIL